MCKTNKFAIHNFLQVMAVQCKHKYSYRLHSATLGSVTFAEFEKLFRRSFSIKMTAAMLCGKSYTALKLMCTYIQFTYKKWFSELLHSFAVRFCVNIRAILITYYYKNSLFSSIRNVTGLDERKCL